MAPPSATADLGEAAAPPIRRLPVLRATPASSAVGLGPSLAAGLTTAALLAIIQISVARPMLLAARFWRPAGWIEIAALALWAAWLVRRLLDPRGTAIWRGRLWLLFSAVFFAQLVLGLAGLERFLMTGALHLPVPAMIVAGPVFRGAVKFMPILFGGTLLLVGPAWCSYLCYLGSWDLAAARSQGRPSPLPRWAGWGRLASLAVVVAVALVLKLGGANTRLAAAFGLAFGLGGLGVMWLSRRRGTMTHCTAYCPIGLLAAVGGKLSPFRLRIADGCDDCQACARACRYDALRPEHIARRRPGLSCTLCGDCVRSCKRRFIDFRFPGLAPDGARTLFLVVVTVLHAVFLGVARI